ncbi:MAG: alpha-amylase [Bacteroidetes bacterium]|nr:MAG: alpha-amylase [Bacteroidota bacterium]
MKKLFLLLLISLFTLHAFNQVISSDPALPLADEAVVIYFDATGTPLESYTGIVYTHTGLLKNGNTSWSNVIGEWGDNNTQPALTPLGNHVYSLNISPAIRVFYEAAGNDDIEKMAFVFRSDDAGTQTENLFLDVFESGLNVSISSPDYSPYIVAPGEIVPVVADANGADSMHLFVDGTLINTVAGNSISQNITVGMQPDSKTRIKVVAEGGGEQVADSVYCYVKGETSVEALPANVRDGINYMDDETVVLCLLAPGKEYIYVIGGFNDWEPNGDYLMKMTPDGERFWLEITDLTPAWEYVFQYFIDGEILVGDPYADKISDPWNDQDISEPTYPGLIDYPTGKTTGIATVLETAQEPYDWQVDDFIPPETTDLVIYEMLIRDFTTKHSYAAVTDTLDYLKRLGVNALELMPVNEFEGNSSWGYNPSYYFAPDKYYGPKNQLKRLIDECHERGIAVILDIVLNHSYDQSPLVQMYFDGNNPTADNPWYNVSSNFTNPDAQWGNDFNHESVYTKNFVDSVNAYWMSEYRFDGFRFDFTKGFSNTPHGSDDPWGSNYDISRITILKRMAIQIRSRNENAIVILEHLSENSEETSLADFGMLMWGNANYNYGEASMAYNENSKSDFSWISYQKRGWNDPHVVGYMESHDEERIMFKNLSWGNASGSYDIKNTGTALDRIRLVSAFFYTIPGPKMIWQFGELGYDYSIDYNGRLGEKPVRWDYYDDWRRNYNYKFIAALIKLRIEHDVFETNDFDLNVAGVMKSIRLNSTEMNVFVAGNFDVEQGDLTADFAHTGTWYEYFSGESLEVTDLTMLITLAAGEYRLYTDVQLETPDIGTSTEESNSIETGSVRLFPNPVSADANLQIRLPQSADVQIRIFNLLGAEVIQVIDRSLAEGIQYVELDLEGLRSGIYFCNISSGQFSDTIKFVKQ